LLIQKRKDKADEVAHEDEITANGVRLSRVLEGLHKLKGNLLLKKSKPVTETESYEKF
jgi:hypothetical protein